MLLVSGPDLGPRPFASESGVAYVGARFQPGEARRMLGSTRGAWSTPAWFRQHVSFCLAALERRLADCGSLPALLERLGLELEALARETSHLRPPRRVRTAIRLLRESNGEPRIGSVADMVGITTRTLHREVVTWTGLPPKVLARIFRFQAAWRRVQDGGERLRAIAAASGYADQAHMAREFRSLAGGPPSARS